MICRKKKNKKRRKTKLLSPKADVLEVAFAFAPINVQISEVPTLLAYMNAWND